MSENCYNEIFENFKSNLVPKFLYEESQLEIKRLKLVLETEAERLQSQYQAHMVQIDIPKKKAL